MAQATSGARRYAEAGYDICEVKQMMGHSSLSTTMLYRHISPERLRQIHSPLDTDVFA